MVNTWVSLFAELHLVTELSMRILLLVAIIGFNCVKLQAQTELERKVTSKFGKSKSEIIRTQGRSFKEMRNDGGEIFMLYIVQNKYDYGTSNDGVGYFFRKGKCWKILLTEPLPQYSLWKSYLEFSCEKRNNLWINRDSGIAWQLTIDNELVTITAMDMLLGEAYKDS